MKKILWLLALAAPRLLAQSSSYGASVPAGIGSPASLGISCTASNASAGTASLFLDRSITVGNAIWKCTLLPDGTTYAWQAPFSQPLLGATVSIGGALITLGGNVSGTATVSGAVQGSNCTATRSDGALTPVGIIIDCAVTAANTVTVRLSAVIAGTPSSTTYNVRVIP